MSCLSSRSRPWISMLFQKIWRYHHFSLNLTAFCAVRVWNLVPSLLTQRWSEQRFSNFFCHCPYQKKTSVYKPHKPFSKQSLTTESVNFSGIKVSRIASTKLSRQSRQIRWSQCQHTLTDDKTLLYYTSSWLSHIGCYLTLWGLRQNWPSGKISKVFLMRIRLFTLLPWLPTLGRTSSSRPFADDTLDLSCGTSASHFETHRLI